MSQTVLFITRIGVSASKYSMNIVVRDQKDFLPESDVYQQFGFPIWEIELESDIANSEEFHQCLQVKENWQFSQAHHNQLRSTFVGQGIVQEFLNHNFKQELLDIVWGHPMFIPRFGMSRDWYDSKTVWFSSILRDSAGFSMVPHLDNSHIMLQVIVNLERDYDTATEFYVNDSKEPVYRAPTQRNHGVIFVNTPGALHSINGITDTRWIWYASVLI